MMQNGGLKKPETLTPKEELVVRYFGISEKRRSLSKSYNTNSRKQFSYFKTYQNKQKTEKKPVMVPVGSDLKYGQERVSS